MAQLETLSGVGFIGCGNMGSALLRQFTQHPPEGAAAQFFVYDADVALADDCAAACGITRCASAAELVQKSTLVVAAVKPQQLHGVLTPLRDALRDKVLVSIAAGITLDALRSLAPGARVIRVMPNTPAQLGAGVSAWTAAENVLPDDKKAFTMLFSASGLLFPLEEKLMNAFTALAGSGPAYAFMLINALAEGGVREGLNKKDALVMTAQTFLGSARMVLELGEHPEVLKDRVTSPGGTTAAGLAALETDAVRSACIKAVAAARARAEELGK